MYLNPNPMYLNPDPMYLNIVFDVSESGSATLLKPDKTYWMIQKYLHILSVLLLELRLENILKNSYKRCE